MDTGRQTNALRRSEQEAGGVDVIVLAGGAIERDRFPDAAEDVLRKAELPILGRPMVEWAVRALRASPRIGRIVVVGSPNLAAALGELGAEVVPEASEIGANLLAGLAALKRSARVLVVSGDLPLLTAAALEDFLVHAPDADVVFPYVEREDVRELLPDRRFVFARTRDGAFTGSAMALVRPRVLLDHWRWVEAFLSARRQSPLSLARMVGAGIAWRYLLGRLTVRDVERRLSALLDMDGRGYRSRFPELAMDVDKRADIEIVEEVLALGDDSAWRPLAADLPAGRLRVPIPAGGPSAPWPVRLCGSNLSRAVPRTVDVMEEKNEIDRRSPRRVD